MPHPLSIALEAIKGIGPVFLKRNLGALQRAATQKESLKDQVNYVLWETRKSFSVEVVNEAVAQAEKIQTECEQREIKICQLHEADYPAILKEVSHPPCTLYFRGNLSLANHAITLAGAAHASRNGSIIAYRLGKYFTEKGISVLTGLTGGIDVAAIGGGGEEVREKAIVVLPSGMGAGMSDRKQQICDGILKAEGLILSEFPPEEAEDQFSVLKAGRVVAGLSKAVILVEDEVAKHAKMRLKSFAFLDRPFGVIEPVASDRESTHFQANVLLIEKGQEGLIQYLQVKEKDRTKVRAEVVVLKGREDYPGFLEKLG